MLNAWWIYQVHLFFTETLLIGDLYLARHLGRRRAGDRLKLLAQRSTSVTSAVGRLSGISGRRTNSIAE